MGKIRAGEPHSEAESNDRQNPLLVMPAALDSLQMDDDALQEACEAAALYSCILPGSGNIIGGNSAVIRHYSRDSTSFLDAGN